jgi:hypothetical protein
MSRRNPTGLRETGQIQLEKYPGRGNGSPDHFRKHLLQASLNSGAALERIRTDERR